MDALTTGRVVADDYESVAVGLLPPGPSWPRGLNTWLRNVLGSFAHEFARVHNRAIDALDETDPRNATETLEAWERVYGLPEPCLDAPPTTTEDRRAAIYAKMVSQGGQSPQYFIDVAAALGYVITIDEPFAFRVDESETETPLYDDAWNYAWIVTGSEAEITAFRTDDDANWPLGRIGDPLQEWANVELECRLGKLKPSHTALVFFYDDADLL